jgi:hypothetical protein
MIKTIDGRKCDVVEVRGFEFSQPAYQFGGSMRCNNIGEVAEEVGVEIIRDALNAFVADYPGLDIWHIEAFASHSTCYSAYLSYSDGSYTIYIDGKAVEVADASKLIELSTQD